MRTHVSPKKDVSDIAPAQATAEESKEEAA